ncbi:Rhs family protein [Marinobacter lipolyticus SM19]|uniref:Rhs family protein n=1 Tax=Marinobacter lipolyticus SM19 TaxID=1318628 RepID=R8B058_9GAMM|nr:putative Ig domain-containing protein [Marinobacter lipolyticus]EON91942.1 Rhs family protein [Marinobacter lipolyticus SM19]
MYKYVLGLAFAWVVTSLGTVNAESFRETDDIVISPDFCSLYPIAVSDSVLASATMGQTFQNIPTGTGPGNFSWLSWQGSNNANTLADALVPPGTSNNYRNPLNASDTQLNVGDWVEGGPGVKNSKAIRSNLDALLDYNIIVPVWGDVDGQGARFNYETVRFAVIRLNDYALSGKGYISFTFERYTRCYNHRPESLDSHITTPEDTPVEFELQAQDADSDALTYEILVQPQHGKIAQSGSRVTYTPDANFYGNDSLQFRVHDGEQLSGTATVSLEVLPVNDAPTAQDVFAETEGGNAVSVTLVGEDIDSEPLAYRLLEEPAHGQFTGDAPGLVYTPDPRFEGLEVLTYEVSDGELQATATITINVIQPNLPPVITSPPVVTTPENANYSYPVAAEDPNEDELTHTLDRGPEGMTIDPASGVIHWLPQAEFTQSVPTFNQQCYVVPSGSVKVYEEGDDASGVSYIAPLFHRVKTAVADAGSYVAPQSVAWHKRNRCLGCHIQTQSLLGMQSSKAKADVDEEAAEYLLTEILSSQLSDGSIRRSHPNYAKNQTAFALWALNAVPERDRTFLVRQKGLDFFADRVTVSGNRAYWTTDHNSGWLRESLGITALVSQAAAGFINDLAELDNQSSGQLEVADTYRMLMPALAEHLLAGLNSSENDSLRRVFRLVGLAEIEPFIDGDDLRSRISAAIVLLDQQLRERQREDGGWSRYHSGSQSDPLTSAWVGLALDYQDPALTDPVVLGNIEYLLESQQAGGTWDTTSGLFSTKLATTSLVMAYLPVALDHLGNPDVRLGHVSLAEGDSGVHELSVELSNLGLADIRMPLDVSFYAGQPEDGQFLGSAQVTSLSSDTRSTPKILVSDDALTDDISVVLNPGAAIEECQINNNVTRAAFVRHHVSDPDGLTDTQLYTLNVEDVNEAPVIDSEPQTVLQGGQSFEYQVEVSDTDVGDAHTFEIVSGPEGLYLDERTGRFTSAPGGIAPGEYEIVVLVTDLRGATSEQTFTLVIHENLPPEIVTPPVLVGDESSGYRYDVDAADPNEGDVLRYGYEIAPDGLLIDIEDGVAKWESVEPYVEGKADDNLFCMADPIESSEGAIAPSVKWHYNTMDVLSVPSVAPLFDSNGDGLYNELDDPIVVANAYSGFVDSATGRLVALDGKTGAVIWTSSRNVKASSNIAVANIQGDSAPEILHYTSDGYVRAADNSGNTLWVNKDRRVSGRYNYGAINVADLNGDGQPEVLARDWVLNAQGQLLWSASDTPWHRASSYAADVDMDGLQEVIIGGYIFKEDGELFGQPLSRSALTALANFDEDDSPEIVGVAGGVVSLAKIDGTLIWESAIPGGGGGSPTVADVDGDGKPEIGVAGRSSYLVFDTDGTVLWAKTTHDYSSKTTGSTVFDFDADGNAEIVYADERKLRVYDGKTGAVKFSTVNYSATAAEYPVVADIDSDGHAEILVSSDNGSTLGLRAIEDANDSWAPTRHLWNQYNYHIDNINDDLTVPTSPVKSWLTHNTFRLNSFPDRPSLGLPDLAVHGITYAEDSKEVSVVVKNRGLAPVNQPFDVKFTHEHFWSGGTELGAQTVPSLRHGEEVVLTLAVDDAEIVDSLRVDLTVPGEVVECVSNNNSARAAILTVQAFDEAGLFDDQKFAVSIKDVNDHPEISSAASGQAFVGLDFELPIEVSDPDIGDSFRYSIVGAPAGVEITPYSGKLSGKLADEGVHTFTVQAEDLSGSLAEQTYVLTVTPPDNTAPIIDSEPAGSVIAGQNYQYNVVATDPDGDEVVYLLSRSQPGMTIDGVSGRISWTPSIDLSGTFPAEVTALDTRGASTKQYFLIEVLNPNDANQPPTITSTPGGAVYAGQLFDYQVTANDPDGDTLTYSLATSESGMTIAADGLFSWLPGSEWIGDTAIVEILVSDGRGGEARQKLTLPVNESANHPPQFTSTPETQALAGSPYGYSIAATDSDGDAFTFSLDQSPNGMTLTGSQVNWTPADTQAGSVHDVVVRVTDARGAASTQSFGIAVNAPAESNEAPEISSIPTSPAFVGEEYQYDVIARDADGDALTYTLEAAPSGMTLNSTGQVRWTPGSDQVAAHAVRIRVSDGKAYATQSFTLDAVEASDNSYPDITSRPNTQAVAGETYQYQLVATDADGDELTYGAMVQPDGMEVDASGLVTWTPTLDQIGIHDVSYFADDGKGRTLQNTSIKVQEEPLPLSATLLVTPDSVNAGDTVTIDIFTDGGRGEISQSVDVDGQPLTLNPYGRATWTASGTGRHTVTATVSDAETTVTEVAYVTIRDDSDTVAPVVTLEGPESGAIVTAPTDIIATVQDDNLAIYEVLISPKGESEWQTIAEGSTSQVSAPVATFDPSLLMNGQYDLAILAVDVNGLSGSDMMSLQVEGDLKVGNFSITLEDLSIPVAGIPIRVTRTYDSRQRFEALDFGQGWSIGYQDAKVEESRTLGSYWTVNQYKRGPLNLITDFCVEPLGAPVVTVTLPTGDVERFEVGASPSCNTYQVIKDVTLDFKPVGDTQSTLKALDDSSARYEGGTLLETGTFSGPVDPTRYLLTTQAGYAYTLNQDFGIEKVVDPNGHTLRYTNDGIFHSSGKAVTFQRDSNGRIKAITTPNGDQLSYLYDGDNNLVSSADAQGNATEYTYNRNHGLLDIIDPLGRTLVRNIYDESGRLIVQEDSDGNRTDFNHDIEGRQSVVTDRNGNTTLYYYDDRGNVTTKVDAAGHSWNYTYDERGNQLGQVDPLGNVTTASFDERNNQLTQTDALGNTVAFSYDRRGQELTIADARGNVYRNSYDSVGNLLTVTDPDGNVAGNNINAQGLVSKTVDVAGNATTYTYDEDGNKLTETNPLGETTRYTYDANGNVLTETRPRTVNGSVVEETTGYVYDANNRVIETRYPDGSTTATEYDVAGNQVATVDALGRRTEYSYDAYGRLTETYHPDGTAEYKTYDGEGNLLTETDPLGRTTRYTYDGLNRVVRTDYPDGSHTLTTYDAAGRVTGETDANGSTTTYEYDAAGRRTAVVDALGNRHSYAYDADGNLVSETDAKGHTTEYTYNALDQRTQTRYHDGTTVTESFDALGRRTSRTDQNGRTTHYEYDALGRLTKVTDALDGVTTYTYDEAGNKLTQTDAEGRTTRWTYDSQGRVLSRTLPMGQTESFTYDAAGNRLSHTDFNGQTTTYSYDLNQRLSQVTYGDGTTESYTYDAVGNRLTATTPEGTTRYSYDAQNRLVEEVQPDGSVLSYGYDAAGNRTQLDVSAGGSTTSTSYNFDALNRLEVVTASQGQTLYTYDAVGNRESVSYPSGNVTLYDYDALNRLTRLTTTDAADQILMDYAYTLDATGRRTQVQEAHSGRTTSYSYDELYRLTGETIADPVNGNHSAEYQFDKVGNRTYSIINGVHTAYSYDNNDRLTQQGGVSYSYDANGNTLTETEDGQVTHYRYDARDKLIEVEKPGLTARYGYNADGIRTRKTENGITTHYVVDNNRDYAQVLAEVTSGTAEVSYTYGDDVVSQTRAGSASYYLYDGHGSTRALASASGSLTDSYDYDAFGVLLNSTGDTENVYRYTGEQLDPSLDQYYLRARYYDQNSGRFTQMDTWQGNNHDPITLHKYLYANADPVSYRDPTGKFSLGSLGAGINIQGVLATANFASSAYSIFQIATGEEELTATQVGSRILFNMLGGAAGKVIGLFGKKFADDFKRAGCSRNSFTAETPVHTESGIKSIEDVAIGDLVWATDPETGEAVLKPVTYLIQGEREYELYLIEFASGEKITATADHPFFSNGEWINAKNLEEGVGVSSLSGDDFEIVISVEKELRKQKVFNITVDEVNTFHVGEAGYLVHNTNIFCSPNITAVFPELKIRGLVRNRNIDDLTGSEIANAFAQTGYKISSHAIGRIKHPRTRDLGFNTLNDIAKIINRGEKIEDRGDVAFIYNGMKAIIIPGTMKIRTIRPL